MPNTKLGIVRDHPKWAIVDIGSNSVRLVIFDGPEAAPISVLNEKVLCRLGQRELQTGRLRDEAVTEALSVLRRYKKILDAAKPKTTIVFATAAARDAPNGPEFLKAINDLGLPVTLLSGKEEARLAAQGVLSAAPEILNRPGGAISGDIGGGSLDLCHISSAFDGNLGPRTSLPLGGLRLATEFQDDFSGAQRYIDQKLDDVEWLTVGRATALYIVGGAWRSLARIAIQEGHYPLEMLDHFTMSKRDVASLVDRVQTARISDLENLRYVQRRRANTLPFAAMVLRSVFERIDGEKVVVSSCGVREGVIYDRLTLQQQRQDPLPVLASYIAGTGGGGLTPDVACVSRFLVPVLESDNVNHGRVWDAAIRLSQVSLMHHPEKRAEQAAQTVMGLPLRGITHRDRAMLATALYFRHGGGGSDLYKSVPANMMSDAESLEAKCVGLGLRFSLELDPNGRAVLPRARLKLTKDEVRLTLAKQDADAWGRGPAKRFDRFASALEKTAVY